MAKDKDYDSTLARMAGNIAAGCVGNIHTNSDPEEIAKYSVTIAKEIIRLLKETHGQSKRV